MSSFVIGKQYYVRVAGYISGIANELSVWLYNYNENRNFTKEDYYKLFCSFYDGNAISVQKQYNDDKREVDSNDYMEDFNEYYKLGKQEVYHGNYSTILNKLNSFFNSVKYQIEDDKINNIVTNTLNKIFVAIYDRTQGSKSDTSCWGTFEVQKHDTEIVDIMDLIK